MIDQFLEPGPGRPANNKDGRRHETEGLKSRFRAESETLEIDILGTIETDDSFGGVTAKAVRDLLKSGRGARRVLVTLNSSGGSFFEGLGIYNLLKAHPAPVRVEIVGLAASAGSLIAMAGDEIAMHDGSWMMIHRASALGIGNGPDFQRLAEDMAKVDETMIGIYSERTGLPVDEVRALVDAETWLDTTEALAKGFATELVGGQIAVAASLSPEWAARFNHAPAALRASSRQCSEREFIVGLKAAAPGVSADFIINQLEAGATVEAAAAWGGRMQDEGEASKAQMERPGVPALATRPGRGRAIDAAAEWNEGISAKVAAGKTRQQAVLELDRERPGLREEFLAAHNARAAFA